MHPLHFDCHESWFTDIPFYFSACTMGEILSLFYPLQFSRKVAFLTSVELFVWEFFLFYFFFLKSSMMDQSIFYVLPASFWYRGVSLLCSDNSDFFPFQQLWIPWAGTAYVYITAFLFTRSNKRSWKYYKLEKTLWGFFGLKYVSNYFCYQRTEPNKSLKVATELLCCVSYSSLFFPVWM